jgi:indole-3-glycerol phosphate synthase
MARDAGPVRDFCQALINSEKGDAAIIAEVKKASPSRGVIVSDFDPVRIANLYNENGAAALSILTDEHFFQGKLEYLSQVKAAVDLPVLRKDFTLDTYHIYEARAAEADAILLIARILEENQLADYRDQANELGMATLIEVHDQADLDKVFGVRDKERFAASLIGINNRNLDSFETDLTVSETLGQAVPTGVPVVAESGIHERSDIERLHKAGINIFLIGEALLVAENAGKKLSQLLGKI